MPVGVPERCHVLGVSFGHRVLEAVESEARVHGHHDVAELAPIDVGAAGPGELVGADVAPEHGSAQVSRGLEGGAPSQLDDSRAASPDLLL